MQCDIIERILKTKKTLGTNYKNLDTLWAITHHYFNNIEKYINEKYSWGWGICMDIYYLNFSRSQKYCKINISYKIEKSNMIELSL